MQLFLGFPTKNVMQHSWWWMLGGGASQTMEFRHQQWLNTTQKLQGPQAFTHVSVANNEGAKQTYHCLGANQSRTNLWAAGLCKTSPTTSVEAYQMLGYVFCLLAQDTNMYIRESGKCFNFNSGLHWGTSDHQRMMGCNVATRIGHTWQQKSKLYRNKQTCPFSLTIFTLEFTNPHTSSLLQTTNQPTNQRQRQVEYPGTTKEIKNQAHPARLLSFMGEISLMSSITTCRNAKSMRRSWKLRKSYETTLELQHQDSYASSVHCFWIATLWSFRILILNLRSWEERGSPTLLPPPPWLAWAEIQI